MRRGCNIEWIGVSWVLSLSGMLGAATTGCVGSGALKPADVLGWTGTAPAAVYAIPSPQVESLVATAAIASEWRPATAEGIPPGTYLYDTGIGMWGVGIWARIRVRPIDGQHTSIEVLTLRKNEAQAADCDSCAGQRFLSELAAAVATARTHPGAP